MRVWHAIGSLTRMRIVYSAIFVGFAVVGFAGVFSNHSPVTTELAATDLSPAHLLARGAPPAPADSTITVQTEFVQPVVVGDGPGEPGGNLPRLQAHRAVRQAQASRSRLARFVFGDGQFRPRPFPTPASGLK
jgi:hypothetical protein